MIRKSVCTMPEAALFVAMLWAELMSKGGTKVGAAVLHPPSGDIFLGYNGFPPGVPDEEELWSSPRKHALLVHAERNAIRKAVAAIGLPLGDCVLVCTMLPCLGCLTEIASSGIKTVYWLHEHADLLRGEDQQARDSLIFTSHMTVRRIELPSHVNVVIHKTNKDQP